MQNGQDQKNKLIQLKFSLFNIVDSIFELSFEDVVQWLIDNIKTEFG